MNPERWQQIEKLCQSTLDREASQRSAFLEEACGGDESLRREVASLLAYQEPAANFIESPALRVAAGLLAEEQAESTIGRRISHYRVFSLLGAGGMGEVYLAEDTRLGRKIALKLLPPSFTQDPERVRRFEQEARAASALNHPNIITIYEIGQADNLHYIATEFIEGQTLRQQMKSGLKLRHALDVAIQAASALSAAHAAGIVHRDIKPENIMLRPDGLVKVLDFGLAKLTERQTAALDSGAPTDAELKTTPGTVMGTAHYMSPEQVRGLKVDARSDICSPGVMIYEMLASKPPFKGATTPDVLAAILRAEPAPLSHHAPEVSAELERIVTKALEKNREERYQSVKDLLLDLKRLKQRQDFEAELERSARAESSGRAGVATSDWQRVRTSGGQAAAQTAEAEEARPTSSAEYLISEIKRHKRSLTLALMALIVALGGISFGLYKLMDPKSALPPQVMRINRITTTGKASGAAISPDGRYVAYLSDTGLWIRQVATNSDVQIAPPAQDFSFHQGLTFSPDGHHLYYVGKVRTDPAPVLYKMPALGGTIRKLIVGVHSQITLSPDGKRLAFIRNAPSESALILVNADGTGERKLATRRDPSSFWSAAWSPDGKRIACATDLADAEGGYFGVVEVGVDDGAEKLINTQRWDGVESLAWLRDGSGLVMVAIDQKDSAAQLWQLAYPQGGVRRITADLNDYSGLSLTADSSALVTTRYDQSINLWAVTSRDPDRAQQLTSGFDRQDGANGISWTPEGKIVFSSEASGKQEIWLMEPDGRNQKQLTVDAKQGNRLSVSPDGRYIVFVSSRTGSPNIWRVDIDGSSPKQLTSTGSALAPYCSSDSQWVFYHTLNDGKRVAWKVPIDGGDPVQLTNLPVDIIPMGAISPDGKLVAHFDGDQAQGKKVAITPVEGGHPIKVFDLAISNKGYIQWTPDGRALSYIRTRGSSSNIWLQSLDGGPPKQLTNFKTGHILSYAWSHDGQYLAVARASSTSDVVLISDFRQ